MTIAALVVLTALWAVLREGRREPPLKAEVRVKPSIRSSFKDLRGVNCGPLSPRGWDKEPSLNLTRRYLELGVRVIRFHDLYGADDLDIIFPDPEADPEDPASYNFGELDKHFLAAMRVADTLIFRIGYDWHDPPKNRLHLGVEKAARVAAHIVMHYTLGWAGGYRLRNILWEVWNEPDIERFWGGTPEEYFRLYGEVASAIKGVNPEAKVGGPTIAYNLEFLERFLNYTRSHGAPLDFVSWHIYAKDPREIAARAARVREIMERYGYGHLPSILDEWNYWWNEEPWDTFRGPLVAFFQASALAVMEASPLDMAALYRGDAWSWGGMFYRDGEPGKPFYVWLAYRRMIEGAQRVEAEVSGAGLAALAGVKPGGELYILVSNGLDREVEYALRVDGGYELSQLFAVDDRHDLDPVDACEGNICVARPHAVHLVIMKPSAA